MRLRIFSLPVLLVLLGFLPPVPGHPVRGSLQANPRVQGASLPEKIQLLVKSGGQLRAKTAADPAGNFTVQLPVIADSALDFFCIAPGLDTLFLRSTPAAFTGPLALLFPCQPDTTSSGDIICPRCRKEDEVYPMVYGDPIVITRHRDSAGKVAYERLPKAEAKTDTVIRAARFYCRRDKINF